jgi:hypothetical protein
LRDLTLWHFRAELSTHLGVCVALTLEIAEFLSHPFHLFAILHQARGNLEYVEQLAICDTFVEDFHDIIKEARPVQRAHAVVHWVQPKWLARMPIRDFDLEMREIWQLMYREGATAIVFHDRANDTPEDAIRASDAEYL